MDGVLHQHGLIDPARTRRALRQAASGTGPALYQVKHTIEAEIWLRALQSAPAPNGRPRKR